MNNIDLTPFTETEQKELIGIINVHGGSQHPMASERTLSGFKAEYVKSIMLRVSRNLKKNTETIDRLLEKIRKQTNKDIVLNEEQVDYLKDFIERWEMADDKTDALTDEYHEWCKENKMPLWSADDLLFHGS